MKVSGKRLKEPMVASVHPGSFPVIQVPDSAPEHDEKGGTTLKFWFHGKQLLYKEARARTGEHWAEKIASELAAELGLSTPYVDLAQWDGKFGVVTCSFLNSSQSYLHAKELFERENKDNAGQPEPASSEHTLPNVVRVLKKVGQPVRWVIPSHIENAADTLIGYLIFDAWISNEDRHNENWGVIETRSKGEKPALNLAPTFDHASSLGRELSDDQRRKILAEKKVTEYVKRCKSGFVDAGKTEFLTTHQVLERSATILARPTAAWMEKLFAIPHERIVSLFDKLPSDAISKVGRDFALAVMDANIECLKQNHGYLNSAPPGADQPRV